MPQRVRTSTCAGGFLPSTSCVHPSTFSGSSVICIKRCATCVLGPGPVSRFTWDLLRGVRAKGGGAGAAVLLTTHSMEEAEALADYVVIMVCGLLGLAMHPALGCTALGRCRGFVQLACLCPLSFARLRWPGPARSIIQ